MDISVSGLFASFIFGVIGLYMFREGKKRLDYRILFLGIGLMIYPYFTTGPLADWGVGTLLCGIAYAIW